MHECRPVNQTKRFFYKKHFYKKMGLKKPYENAKKNLMKILRKSLASDASAEISKNADFSQCQKLQN